MHALHHSFPSLNFMSWKPSDRHLTFNGVVKDIAGFPLFYAGCKFAIFESESCLYDRHNTSVCEMDRVQRTPPCLPCELGREDYHSATAVAEHETVKGQKPPSAADTRT